MAPLVASRQPPRPPGLARDGRLQDLRAWVVDHGRPPLFLAGGLFFVPVGGGGQRLAVGAAEPPPVAVPDVAVEDELVRLFPFHA
jgi:hypothetical protein